MDKSVIKKIGKVADKIISLESVYQSYNDEKLASMTSEFKNRLNNGEKLNDILVDAYAVCREASFRILKLKAYKVQLIGAIVINDGDIGEMKTGEGKTLTALFPTYLNALNNKGVHIVTVNEYLSERDFTINSKVLNFLKISTGLNLRKKNPIEKKQAYAADVTFTTNSELGFDYLRDNMAQNLNNMVQRGLEFAIIDEADSILIDEARTPLIISGGKTRNNKLYIIVDKFAKSLSNEDYILDLESKNVNLSDSGIKKAQFAFKINSLFSSKHTGLYHLILNALKANYAFKKDIEYVVQDNKIILIDKFTGRLMDGRSYSDGLQQAIQAKENVEIEVETVTVATITYQNFFRLYSKLSGMTGTAKTEEEEFIKIYNTRVIKIPTNEPIIRKDEADYMFHNRDAKLKALINEVKKLNAKQQPILIGTTSVESSEIVSHYLDKANLKYEVLNAKNHAREAEIIAKAGQHGAITLATNMAGRGTDIKLGKGIAEIGGLAVFGVERNESRRIDNQLRGRSGRQGDPGFSRFYIAADDDLMIRFGGERLSKLLSGLKNDHFQSRLLTRRISGAQKKVEGMNFDIRKNILDYDNVIAQHREVIYAERHDILKSNNLDNVVKKMEFTVAYDLLKMFSKEEHNELFINYPQLKRSIEGKIIKPGMIDIEKFKQLEFEEIAKIIAKNMWILYSEKISDIPEEVRIKIEKQVIIRCIDRHWTNHIDQVTKLRSGIHLRSYSQTNPLHEYIKESAEMFKNMKVQISHQVVIMLITAKINISDPIPKKDSEKSQMEFRQVG